MCLIDCNIIEVENKEIRRNSDITYEERVKIEYMLKKKYTMQEMAEELGRNKSIISREINRHCDIQEYARKYILQQWHKENMNIVRKKQEEKAS